MFETLRSSFHGIDLSNSLTPSQSPSRATVVLTSLSYLVGDKCDQRMEKQTQLKRLWSKIHAFPYLAGFQSFI